MKRTIVATATLCGMLGLVAADTPAAKKAAPCQCAPAKSLYLVVDLSGGTNAVSYPVSHLDAVPKGGWTDEYKSRKLVMRRIDPGSFIMGCTVEEKGYNGGEAVPHKVTITNSFYIGVFEVTQKQYELVTGLTPSSYKGDTRPVEDISWNHIRGESAEFNWPMSNKVDEVSFIGVLRAKTGIASFDLPTEARWEYACRAGTTNALNSGKEMTNCGSGTDPQVDEVGRYYYNRGDAKKKDGKTNSHEIVGSYKPNAWGLYDMHGNVWEWCLDWYQGRGSFDSRPVTDPVGPRWGSGRVQRGGSWSGGATDSRSASRNSWSPAGKHNNYGFRLCCAAEK